jgi:hypothetical protein
MKKLRIADCTLHSREALVSAGINGLRICIVVFLLFACLPPYAAAAEKWPGVDETVVEKYAKEHGRQAHEPLVNTDQATSCSLYS